MNLCSFYYICEQRFYARGEREKNEENRGAVLREWLVCPEDRTLSLAFAFCDHHRVSQPERSPCRLRSASLAGGFAVGRARASACDRYGTRFAQRQRARRCIRVRETLAGGGGRERLLRFIACRCPRRLLADLGEGADPISLIGESASARAALPKFASLPSSGTAVDRCRAPFLLCATLLLAFRLASFEGRFGFRDVAFRSGSGAPPRSSLRCSPALSVLDAGLLVCEVVRVPDGEFDSAHGSRRALASDRERLLDL